MATNKTQFSRITIVIGTLNRPTTVLKLLSEISTFAQEDMEVLVIDQSSQSNYHALHSAFPRKKNYFLYHFDKPNTCKYLNFGWKNAHSPIVLYLDDDVTLSRYTINEHINSYKNISTMGVAGRVINKNEKSVSSTKVGKILWHGAEFVKNFSAAEQQYVDFPYGCNMSFRKEVLERIGGFDENLLPPIYAYNEIDIGYRINKKWKKSIIFEPKTVVHHLQSETGGTRNNFTTQTIFQSTQYNYGYFLGKNFTWLQNIVCFLRRFTYQIIKERSAIPHMVKGFIYGKQSNAKLYT